MEKDNEEHDLLVEVEEVPVKIDRVYNENCGNCGQLLYGRVRRVFG